MFGRSLESSNWHCVDTNMSSNKADDPVSADNNGISTKNMLSDMLIKSGMTKCRNRANNWTEHDKLLAAQRVMSHEQALYGSKDMGHDIASKRAEWNIVTQEFCAEADEPRTPEQLKKAFENMRSAARKYIDCEDYSVAVTGRPQSQKSPPPSLQLVIDKLRNSARRRFIDYVDCDGKEPFFSRIAQYTPLHPADDSKGHSFPENGDHFNHGVQTEAICLSTECKRKRSAPSESDTDTNSSALNCSVSYDYVKTVATKKEHRDGYEAVTEDNSSERCFDMLDRKQTLVTEGKVSQKRQRTSCSETLDYWATQNVKAEYEKMKMETELIKQRMEHEAVLFNLKKRSLEAKLQYYSFVNRIDK